MIKSLICLVVALQLTACVLGTRTVELTYPPEQKGKLINHEPTAPTGVRFSRKAVRLKVSDEREETGLVGNLRNTYGMNTADIITNDNVERWVQDALVYELDLLGISVVADQSADQAEDETPLLIVDILKAYCDVYAFYDAEVTLKGGLWYGTEQRESGTFPVQVNSGMSIFGTGKAVGESLAEALEQSILQLLALFGFGQDKVQPPAPTP